MKNISNKTAISEEASVLSTYAKSKLPTTTAYETTNGTNDERW